MYLIKNRNTQLGTGQTAMIFSESIGVEVGVLVLFFALLIVLVLSFVVVLQMFSFLRTTEAAKNQLVQEAEYKVMFSLILLRACNESTKIIRDLR